MIRIIKKIYLLLLPLFLFAYQTNAQLVVSAGAPQTVCYNTSVTLGGNPTASGGTAPYTYKWTPNLFLNDSTSANPLAMVYQTTTYLVVVHDALGNTDSASVVISVHQLLCSPTVTDSCFNTNGGSIQVTINGTPPYT